MLKKLGILALFSLTTSVSFANVDTVRENIKKQYPNLKISNIQKTEMPGLIALILISKSFMLVKMGNICL